MGPTISPILRIPLLHLYPLIKAQTRIDRLIRISERITNTARQHPWLSVPLLPPHLLVRWLNRREINKLNRLGYPVKTSN